MVSVTQTQPRFKNIKWKNSRNKSWVLNCTLFWVAWWNPILFHSMLPGMWITPLSRTPMLCALPAWLLLSSVWIFRSVSETGERNRIYITFITIYYSNCSILLLDIVINLLLCLIYKLNFIIGTVCIDKNTVHIGFSSCHFRHHCGSWTIPSCVGGGNCMYKINIRIILSWIVMKRVWFRS